MTDPKREAAVAALAVAMVRNKTWDGVLTAMLANPQPFLAVSVPSAVRRGYGRRASRTLTTTTRSHRLSRRAVLIDLSAEYLDQAMVRNNALPLGM